MKVTIKIAIFSTILWIAGTYLIVDSIGWKAFGGIFLIMWGNNIAIKPK